MFIIAVPTPPVIAAPSYSRRLRTNKSYFFHLSSYRFVFRARSLFNFGCRSFNPVKFLQVSSRRNRPRRLSGIPWGPESSDLDSGNGTLKDSNHGWLCLAPRVQSLSDTAYIGDIDLSSPTTWKRRRKDSNLYTSLHCMDINKRAHSSIPRASSASSTINCGFGLQIQLPHTSWNM